MYVNHFEDAVASAYLFYKLIKTKQADCVFTLDYLESERFPERHAKRLKYEMSDGTDVNAWAYFADDGGLLFTDHAVNIDTFEYYKRKLEGKERALYFVSRYIKGEIDLPDFLYFQNRIVVEETLENIFSSKLLRLFLT